MQPLVPVPIQAQAQADVEVVDESLRGVEGELEGQAMKDGIDQFWTGNTRDNHTASHSSSSSGSSSFDGRVETPTLVATLAPTPNPTAAGAFHLGVIATVGDCLKLEALLRASSSSACFFARACLSLHVMPPVLPGNLAGCSCTASCARFSNGLINLLGLGS